MRALNRNKQKFYYCRLLNPNVDLYDQYGNKTGEHAAVYALAEEFRANISPATGLSATEQFGGLENYDKVIVTTDMSCPITETTVLFVDKEPSYTTVTAYNQSGVQAVYSEPAYDYVVARVSKSINSISYAIRKVSVS